MADCHEYLSNSLWEDPGILSNQAVSDLTDHQSSQAGVETPSSLTDYLELLWPKREVHVQEMVELRIGVTLRRPIPELFCSLLIPSASH